MSRCARTCLMQVLACNAAVEEEEEEEEEEEVDAS
jgi:hypothetical protein